MGKRLQAKRKNSDKYVLNGEGGFGVSTEGGLSVSSYAVHVKSEEKIFPSVVVASYRASDKESVVEASYIDDVAVSIDSKEEDESVVVTSDTVSDKENVVKAPDMHDVAVSIDSKEEDESVVVASDTANDKENVVEASNNQQRSNILSASTGGKVDLAAIGDMVKKINEGRKDGSKSDKDSLNIKNKALKPNLEEKVDSSTSVIDDVSNYGSKSESIDNIDVQKPKVKKTLKANITKSNIGSEGGSFGVSKTPEAKKYPIIEPISSETKYSELMNITESSSFGYIAAGSVAAITIAEGAWLHHSLVNQLGKAIKSGPLAKTVINSNSIKFLSMNQQTLETISGIGEAKSNGIMGFYGPFVNQVAIAEKSVNAVADFGKALHEPSANNIIKVTVDIADLAGSYYNSPYSALLPIGNAVYLSYQGEFIEAAGQFALASTYVLPFIMTPASPFSLVILAGLGVATTYNVYAGLNDYLNDSGNIDAMMAYKGVFEVLSKTPIKSLNDFAAEKVKEYDVAINDAKLERLKDNIKQYLIKTKGEFGENIFKYIHLPIITRNHELVTDMKQGKIKPEQLTELMPKHVKIELESREYDHCIEFKEAVHDYHNTKYHCYNDELQVIDQVTIGKDTTNLVSVDIIYSGS